MAAATLAALDGRRRAARLALTSIVFCLVYTLCNHYTGTRVDIGAAIFEWERAIPFVPWTIVPYLSILFFFALSFFVGHDAATLHEHVRRLLVDLTLSVLCYLLFPLRFQFERPPVEGLCGALYALLAACDLPYNRAPSLHISALLLLWLRLAPFTGGALRWALQLWFVLIGISVLTTWQHHLIDVPAGLAVGAASVWIAQRLQCWLVAARRIAASLGLAALVAALSGCADPLDAPAVAAPRATQAAVPPAAQALPAARAAPVGAVASAPPRRQAVAAPHGEPVDHAARTRLALYASRAEAERIDAEHGGRVVWLDAVCCGDEEIELVAMLAYGELAARNLDPDAVVLVTGSDQRLAARLVDRLAQAGVRRAYLVTR